MTPLEAHPEHHPELTLELARLSSEPSAGDKSRNLGALRSRLGLPPPTVAGPGASAPSAAPAPSANPPPITGTAFASWRQLIAVGVVTGTIGFFMGLGFERAPEPQLAANALRSATVAAAPTSLAAPSSSGPSSGPPGTPSSAPSSVAEAPAAVPARARPAVVHPASAKRAAAIPAASPGNENDFARAVQLLARARRALDRGETELALGLLDELDTTFPRTLLDEERGATRVLALCANGEQDSALRLARQLFMGRARSIYARRLERSCAGAALGARSEP